VNLELPEATVELAQVIRRRLADLVVTGGEAHAGGNAPGAPDAAQIHAALDELGVFDLAGAASPDPDNAQLNVAVAIEEVARGKVRVPIAETLWAGAHGLDTAGAFVSAPSAAAAGGDRLVPYGTVVRGLIEPNGSGVKVIAVPTGSRPAHVEVDHGHLWCPMPTGTSSFAELDPPFAWRAAAATTVGAMTAATEMSVEHARTRIQFGKPIGSFQAMQFRLAECHWRVLGLRLLVREAAWRADRDDPRAAVVSALAWLYARDVGRVVTRHAHQVHGAIGVTRELGLTDLSGSVATLRVLIPSRAAAEMVRQARGWLGDDPPSTVFGGFSVAAG
jgi:hypothetical protein